MTTKMQDILMMLVEYGAPVHAADLDGISFSQAAVIAGSLDSCRILYHNYHANPDQADQDGVTPRSCAEDDPLFGNFFD